MRCRPDGVQVGEALRGDADLRRIEDEVPGPGVVVGLRGLHQPTRVDGGLVNPAVAIAPGPENPAQLGEDREQPAPAGADGRVPGEDLRRVSHGPVPVTGPEVVPRGGGRLQRGSTLLGGQPGDEFGLGPVELVGAGRSAVV